MAEPDWGSMELDHRLRCLMVDPTDRSHTLGELQLELGGNSITWDVGSETRASARVAARDWYEWSPNSWLRLVHEIPSCGYSRDLFTGFVWEEGAEGGPAGYVGAKPTLMGPVKALETDRLAWPMSVGAGARASDVLTWLCESALCTAQVDGTVGSYRFASARVYDAGTTKLDVALELCAQLGAEMTCDGRGSVVFARRVSPGSKAPRFTLDCDAPGTPVLASGLARGGNGRQAASRMVVTFRDGDSQVSGYADVWGGHPADAQLRGYRVTESESPSDAPEPHDQWRAQQEARARLPEASAVYVEWSCETRWLPLREGDAVMFRPPARQMPDGTRGPAHALRKCEVTTIDADLSQWRLKMTLREV